MDKSAKAARQAYNKAYWKRKAEELEAIKKGNNDGNQ